MITQKIVKYAIPLPALPAPHGSHMVVQNQSWSPGNPLAMGKLEFALFAKALGVKKGDLVTYTGTAKPFSVHSCNLVIDIDQVHKWVDWGHETTGPKILELASFTRVNLESNNKSQAPTWKGGTKNWIKVDPVDYPKEWVEWFKRASRG